MPRVGVGPLSSRLLQVSAVDGELVPAWLGDRDRPWLRDLLAEAEAARGRPLGWLLRRWRAAAPDPRAGGRDLVGRHVVWRILSGLAEAPAVAERRRRLFRLAAEAPSRDEALATCATEFATTKAQLLDELFADLPMQRRVRLPPAPLEPLLVALTANLALAQGLLCRATAASLELRGAARAVLRTAWLHGAHLEGPRLEGDGIAMAWRPATALPGQARGLAALAPVLPWCRTFRLAARCRVGSHDGTLVLATGDPILPGPEPRPYDSAIERAFARDFAAALPEWELLREPRPLQVGDQLAFPDFALRCRSGGPQWLLEIAGLRDPAVLAQKLALLAAAERLLLCLPRRGLPAELLQHPRVVPFARRLDVAAVRRALDADGTGSVGAGSAPLR